MDRPYAYAGAVPLDTDFLKLSRYTMEALGWALQGYLGGSPVIDGLTVSPTTPSPSLSVVISSGAIYSIQPVDQQPYGALGADTTHSIVKQGILRESFSIAISPPSTSGFAQNVLIQVAFAEADANPTVLPYFNSANPASAFNGPNNSGASNFTDRTQRAFVSAKYGVAAAAGTQSTPSPDAGYIPIAVVTVSQGQTQITSGNIASHASAPLILSKLPQVPYDVQSGKWLFAQDVGTANALSVTLSPAPASFPRLLAVKKGSAANTDAATITVNALGTVAIKRPNGVAVQDGDLPAFGMSFLAYDGAGYQVVGGSVASLFIKADTTFIIAPSGGDFTSIAAALNYLRYTLIAPDVTVTIQLSAGQFTITSPITLPHINGPRIVIKGQATGTIPVSSDIVANATTTLTTLRARFPTEIVCSGCNGLEALRGSCVRIENLLLTGSTGRIGVLAGDSINAPVGASATFYGSGQITAINCWVHGFSVGWWSRQQGNISGSGIGASFCGDYGLVSNNHGYVTGLKVVLCRNGVGAYTRDRGYIELSGAQINNNTGDGVVIGHGARVNIAADGAWGTITGNGGWGVNDANGGDATIASMNLGSNTSGSARAVEGSENLLQSCTSVGTLSPVANTIGNNQSINIVI